ncbi:DNA-binding MarR family transcriptional regulator [Amycolatopsis endophytica]|uniref:DNA-binding MarR family transcriptional regulator n=1 Tax=Amycolatopsis endophytica TaxID=860233 RepID=A0A853AWP2_9PSEU|nr:MarR family winged helix-turn-helix transcriptional regulator [Amycolatopsis endophytica]NYI87078.1 DNA-binding MarR family transcriptional regulator [Amycolatopsis endophytica]
MRELAENLMTTTAALRRVTRRRVRETLPHPPLRVAQIELLREVEKQPGTGVAAAARSLHLAGNSVSTLVNQLVDAGLLERRVDPDDRRAARLDLTGTARERLANWRRTRTEFVATAVATLPAEDREAIEAALPALGRLIDALQEER